MGLSANCRRGLVVGVAVSLLWIIPQFIARWKSGQAFVAPDLTAGVWLNAIVGSPFAEELLYRQIVFRNLSQRLPLWKAAGASAFWFTLLHVPAAIMTTTPVELLQYLSVMFAYGVVFACVFSLAKSLWGPLIPHVLNNVFYTVVAGQ
jgi:membrane protease YdiL (CAAX protease family)